LKALVINPGATSTKISVFEEDKDILNIKISHNIEELSQFEKIIDQLPYRMIKMQIALEEAGSWPLEVDCVIGRGGLVRAVPSGTFAINDKVLEEITAAKYGEHASNLGIPMAKQFSLMNNNIPCYFTNPVSVDEMEEVARVSGYKGMYRKSLFHALNHKAAAEKAAEKMGKPYEETKMIVAHLGGGVSVCAHKDGKVVDVFNVKDEGAFALDRCGSLPVNDVIKLCYENRHESHKVKFLLGQRGGVYSYLGTTDLIEVEKMIDEGNEEAALIFEALAYQLAKDMGAMHCVLLGQTEAVVLTGGMANSKKLVSRIQHYAGHLAQFIVLPGEFEMEAMAKNAIKATKTGVHLEY